MVVESEGSTGFGRGMACCKWCMLLYMVILYVVILYMVKLYMVMVLYFRSESALTLAEHRRDFWVNEMEGGLRENDRKGLSA